MINQQKIGEKNHYQPKKRRYYTKSDKALRILAMVVYNNKGIVRDEWRVGWPVWVKIAREDDESKGAERNNS